jgi:hypothetical protein
MMLNMATGAGRVAQGDLEGGFRQMLPLGLSSMVKAYQMTDQGLHRLEGQRAADGAERARHPCPGGRLQPGAECRVQRGAQRSDAAPRHARSSVGQMRNKIVSAMVDGDHDTARGLIEQAMVFDRANPGFGVLRGVEGSIRRRRQAQAVSERMDVPIGVSPKDTKAPQLTRYADVEFRAQ